MRPRPSCSSSASSGMRQSPAAASAFGGIKRARHPLVPAVRSSTLPSPSPRTSSAVFFNSRQYRSSQTANMPTYIVTCKDDATDAQIKAAKEHATSQGGTIEHEYSLIKAFSVTFPEDAITTLQTHEHVDAVELDQAVHTM